MKKISLNGKWLINYSQKEDEKFYQKGYIPKGWLEGEVPGDVYSILRDNGLMTDFHWDRDKKELALIEGNYWWYWKEIFISEDFKNFDEAEVDFKGLDTISDIWLNGVSLGHSENMFLPFSQSIKNKIRYGQRNLIVIRFTPTVKKLNNKDFSKTWSEQKGMAVYRKAAMDYGWDFNSRLCTLGIWRDAEIIFYNKAKIGSVFCYTDKISGDKKKAKLNLEVKLKKFIKVNSLSLDIRLTDGQKKNMAKEDKC
jgi:beta-mannosidase